MSQKSSAGWESNRFGEWSERNRTVGVLNVKVELGLWVEKNLDDHIEAYWVQDLEVYRVGKRRWFLCREYFFNRKTAKITERLKVEERFEDDACS